METDDQPMWVPSGSQAYVDLWKAVGSQDLEALKAALQPDLNVNGLYGSRDDMEGRTLLHHAAEKGSAEVVHCLLDHGATVDSLSVDRFGPETPMHVAASMARPDVLTVLLDAGADINKVDIQAGRGGNALHLVLLRKTKIEQRHLDTINLLLDRGIDIRSRAEWEQEGATILHHAIRLGSLDLMQLLIGRGAVVDNEVLKMASRHQTAAVTSFLLSQGATDEDTFALSFAAGEGKVDIVRALLESQEYSEEALQRTLHEAARVGALDVISYLLDYGMDIDTRDNRGNTTLLATCRSVFPCRPRPDVIQYLISRGANVLSCTVAAPEDPQGGGNNALHLASFQAHPEIVRLLLDAGLDGNAVNDHLQTPLMLFAKCVMHPIYFPWAQQSPRLVSLRMVCEATTNMNALDDQGKSALHHLAQGNRYNGVEIGLAAANYLLDSGVDPLIRDKDRQTAAELVGRDDTLRDILARRLD